MATYKLDTGGRDRKTLAAMDAVEAALSSSEAPRETPAYRKLIDAGVSRLRREGASIGVDVSLRDAAEDAGIQLSTAYKVMDARRARDGGELSGQDLFRRQVAFEALEQISTAEPNTLVAAVRAAMDVGASLPDLVRVLAKSNLEGLIADRVENSVLYALYARSFVDAEMGEKARATYEDFTTFYSALYEEILERYDLELKPGIDMVDLTTALTAVTDGYVLRCLIEPEVFDRTTNWAPPSETKRDEWPAISLIVMTVIDGLTQPKQQQKPARKLK